MKPADPYRKTCPECSGYGDLEYDDYDGFVGKPWNSHWAPCWMCKGEGEIEIEIEEEETVE